jgi:hypothetical protein
MIAIPYSKDPIIGNMLFWMGTSTGSALQVTTIGIEWQTRHQNICEPKSVNHFLSFIHLKL